ncbi:MAG: efflux RND transporter periplasmic adaptor subunit [Flavobacteriales bacterium]|nr:efflux RND transporter periplasmic adaptor subunit [Flavobacteriales bacterium]
MRTRFQLNHTMSRITLPFLLTLVIAIFTSCGDAPVIHDAQTDDHGAAHGPEVTLTVEQIKAIGLVTASPTRQSLSTGLKANGRLVLPPQNMADVSVLMGGLVKQVMVQEGEAISQGQTLALLENLDFLQLQQDYLATKATLTLQRAELERQQALATDKINATRTLQQAQADLDGTEARYSTMEQKLRLFSTDPAKLTPANIRSAYPVQAPIGGFIKRIMVNTGQYADPLKAIFSIVDNRFLHVDLTVFEQDVHKVKEGQRVTITDAHDPDVLHTATIFGVNRAFEADQQAVLVHARIDEKTHDLLPGMFVQAVIEIDSTAALSLPDEAIVSNGDDHYIYVEHQPHVFTQVQVRTGASALGFSEITPLEPLASDAKVVVKGAYYLLSELTKGEGEHHE